MWRLGKVCGAFNNGSRSVSLVRQRFNVVRCWKMGWAKVFMHVGESPIGVLERLRWVREEEKGRWIKLPKWVNGSCSSSRQS